MNLVLHAADPHESDTWALSTTSRQVRMPVIGASEVVAFRRYDHSKRSSYCGVQKGDSLRGRFEARNLNPVLYMAGW